MSEEGAEEMEPFTMISTEEVGTAGLLGTIRNGKTWIQVAAQLYVCDIEMYAMDGPTCKVTCQ